MTGSAETLQTTKIGETQCGFKIMKRPEGYQSPEEDLTNGIFFLSSEPNLELHAHLKVIRTHATDIALSYEKGSPFKSKIGEPIIDEILPLLSHFETEHHFMPATDLVRVHGHVLDYYHHYFKRYLGKAKGEPSPEPRLEDAYLIPVLFSCYKVIEILDKEGYRNLVRALEICEGLEHNDADKITHITSFRGTPKGWRDVAVGYLEVLGQEEIANEYK